MASEKGAQMDISALLANLASAAQLVPLLIDERDRQKAASIQVDLTNKLTEAQAQLVQVLGAVIEQQRLVPVLEQRIRELEAQVAQKGRYLLAKVGTQGQFFAYRPSPVAELEQSLSEVEHFLCQPCFDAGKKVVLVGNGDGYWHCPVCKHGAQTSPEENPVQFAPRRSRFDGY
jgi:hypothetical protein